MEMRLSPARQSQRLRLRGGGGGGGIESLLHPLQPWGSSPGAPALGLQPWGSSRGSSPGAPAAGGQGAVWNRD
ncbi:unnamed protein product [Lota lota]